MAARTLGVTHAQAQLMRIHILCIDDPGQNTGLRVDLPFPDCSKQVSDCEMIELTNTLDGFNLQPRLSIPFTGPINVETVTSDDGLFGDGTVRDSEDGGFIETAVDLMQLVQLIQMGVDVDDNGVQDLDSSRIYYVGQSLGGMYGLLFLAAEPDVSVGVLNTPDSGGLESRLSPVNRQGTASDLAHLEPTLTNVGDPDSCEDDGNDCDLRFNENLSLRNQPPVINDVPGAMAIQAFLDRAEWIGQIVSPVAYGTHLRKKPLGRLPAKAVIIQFAKGDQNVSNPSTTAILRAGELADRATFFRHDLVFNDPTVGEVTDNPHAFLTFGISSDPQLAEFIVLSAQQQVAEFFASDGTLVIDPDGPEPFFEVPIVPPLPEDCGYVVEIPDFKVCQ
jgi:dienelactone hydrolase